MLAVPNHVLVLCIPGNGLQEGLFYYFPRDGGKADLSLVCLVLLHALIEGGCHIYIFPNISKTFWIVLTF